MTDRIDIALKGQAGAFALDIGFDVPAQGLTAIWGASGAGKTTLLRAIAGLSPLTGHVRIKGDVWQDGHFFKPVHQRRIGFVFQEPSLLSHLNVRGNLDYAHKRKGDAAVDLDHILGFLRLEPLLSRRVDTLSGGERQRVALGRTLLSAPDILLMDEPLSSLDNEAKAEIIPLIADLSRQSAIPILYVSHDGFEIERLANRILRLAKGRLIEPTETKPVNLEGLSDAEIRSLAEAALRAGIRA